MKALTSSDNPKQKEKGCVTYWHKREKKLTYIGLIYDDKGHIDKPKKSINNSVDDVFHNQDITEPLLQFVFSFLLIWFSWISWI